MPASTKPARPMRAGAMAPPSHDERFDALLHLARAATGARVAFVSTVVGDWERIRAQVGDLGVIRVGASTPLSDALLGHVLTTRAPIAVADTRHHFLTRGAAVWVSERRSLRE